ncbi:aminotransferase class I/II-fold pyridoxal phosphate-dependent enzyme, partial [Hansschlegelia beijingensis]
MLSFNAVFAGLPVTVFETMSRLARDLGAINLGQGFPDDPGPEDVRRKAAEAVLHGPNQYPPMMGAADLRAAVAAHYRRFQGVSLDPETEVLITSGATEALAGRFDDAGEVRVGGALAGDQVLAVIRNVVVGDAD